MVWEPNVARSSGRVGSLEVTAAPLPLRNVAAMGMAELAVLMVRASAILLLLSPVALLALLAFA